VNLLKTRAYAAWRFLREYRNALYDELGELAFLDEFRDAFYIGAFFPDLAAFAPFARSVSHDDPWLLACATCGSAAPIEAARCERCASLGWAGDGAFHAAFAGDRKDAKAVEDLIAAARRSEARLLAEWRRVGTARGRGHGYGHGHGEHRGVALNLFQGEKRHLPDRLRLDKAFFEDVAGLPASRFAAAGVEPLKNATGEQVGFFAGVTLHLVFDWLLESELAAAGPSEREALSEQLLGDRLRKIGKRLLRFAGSEDAQKGLKQAAFAIVGRWPESTRPIVRDGKVQAGQAPFLSQDVGHLIQKRFPEYVRRLGQAFASGGAAGGDLQQPGLDAAGLGAGEHDRFLALLRGHLAAAGIGPGPAGGAPGAPGAPLDRDRLEHEVKPVLREAFSLLKDGYPEPPAAKPSKSGAPAAAAPGGTGGGGGGAGAGAGASKPPPATLAESLFYPRRWPKRGVGGLHCRLDRPADLAAYLLEPPAPIARAEAGSSDWGRAYESSGEPKTAKEADRHALGSMTDAELVHFCVVHAVGPAKETGAGGGAGARARAGSGAESGSGEPAEPELPPPSSLDLLGSRRGHFEILTRAASKRHHPHANDLAFFYEGTALALTGIVLGDGTVFHLGKTGLRACAPKELLKPSGRFDALLYARSRIDAPAPVAATGAPRAEPAAAAASPAAGA